MSATELPQSDLGVAAPTPAPHDVVQRVMWVLWPSFLLAGVAEMLVFSLFDPADLQIFGASDFDRTAVYTIGFFVLWAVTAASSTLTVFLARSPWQVNHCPLPFDARPPGCPRGPGSCNGC